MENEVHKKRTKDFKFKQFSIYGGFSGMPVSTDGVLLGAWINANQDHRILDIGSGTGLLSLMCAQRFSKARIHAVELDPSAYAATKHNFLHSPWSGRLTAEHADILQWKAQERFNTIICNPPYFNNGEKAQSSNRALARHTDTLNHQDLLRKCMEQMEQKGKASFVLPNTEGMAFIALAKDMGWSLSKLCRISPTSNKPVNRLLIELALTTTSTEYSELMINEGNGYSRAFIELTRSFYLKM